MHDTGGTLDSMGEWKGKAERCGTCGSAFNQKGRGRPRRYCSDVCRQRASRDRASMVAALPNVIRDAPVIAPGRPVHEQIRRGVMEARAVGFAFQRLAAEASPAVGWRCTRLGELIIAAVVETFGDLDA